MSTSEARILANRSNAALSTGPRTEEGKAASRANALKHGLTGAGVVLPGADAAEVDRRSIAFARELDATGEVGHALARCAALNSVRMERGADQQTAALAERVRRVEAEFVPPEGVSAEEADRLRAEAGRIAMFDPSKEATLARRYEAAAERAFFRCLKELRQMGRQARVASPAADARASAARLGSFLAAEKGEAGLGFRDVKLEIPMPRKPADSPQLAAMVGGVDVPITIGRRR